VITEKELFEHMTRSGSGVTLAEAKGNYEEIVGSFEYFLLRGYGINTEFVNIRPVISGVFKNGDDKFEASRHKIKYAVSLGKRYNRTAEDVKVEKVAVVSNTPLPVTFEDVASETINETLTPGGTAALTGMRLKFDRNDLIQGIFLIDSAKNEYRVEKILSHTSTHVVMQIPVNLPQNEYTLEVRNLPKGNKIVKTGTLFDRLLV
jgi:hypothetical protein